MKKLVSMLLAIVMMTNMFVAGAYSVENVTSSVDSGSYQLDEHVSLEIETDQEGVVTISQYNDGVLVETVVSDPDNPDSILSTTYENENPVGTEIDISDVKVIRNTNTQENGVQFYRSGTLGKIRYDTISGLQTVSVSYDITDTGTDAVVIPGSAYSIAQLTGIIVAALSLPGAVAGGIAAAIFSILGFGTTVGTAFIDGTFAVEYMEYTYNLENLTTGDFSDTMKSTFYLVTDDSHNGETFWDGYDPDEAWGDMGFAEEVFIHIIGGTVWSVDAWL